MNSIPNYEYLPRIDAEKDNAVTLQALTLQDVTLGGFEDPLSIANPANRKLIKTQLGKLKNNPTAYTGYRQENGLIVAYMKAQEWFTGDEVPFIEDEIARQALIAAGKSRGGSMEPKAYGVFGLVVDRTIEQEAQSEIFYDLLTRSIGQAAVHSAELVNIVIHDKDPVLPIALDLGFQAVGTPGNAAGAPGLLQQRYQRAA